MDSVTIVRALAIVFILVGITFALRPDFLKAVLRFTVKGKILYLVAGIRICVGMLFIWVGGRQHATLLGILGAIIVVVGVAMLLIRLQTQTAVVRQFIDRGQTLHRCMGIIAVVIGTLIFVETYARW